MQECRAPSWSWASIDGPTHYNEAVTCSRSMTDYPGRDVDFLQQFALKIEEAATIPDRLNKYGCVIAGHIRVRGLLKYVSF
jgi:hypothetical protein